MKYIIGSFLLIFSIGLKAQQTQTDAVYEKIIKEYTLNKDGSQEFHYYKKLKLNTHYSFNRLYGETFIIYNPEVQKLTINNCQTTHQDGKVTEAPFNALNEVLPRFASDAPFYNHLREMVVTHPGTEVGAILELDYTLFTAAGYYPGLMNDEILTESSPVQKEEIVIRIPENEELNYKVFNLRTAPEITSEGNFKVYRFTFSGIKENSHESYQPINQAHLPRIIFSTLTWEEALQFVYQQPIWNYKTDKKMQELVSEIRADNKYDLPFILKLNKEVAENINNWQIPWNYAGYKARIPIETWESNGGNPIEKSLMFTALLREGGINAYPALAIPSELYDPNIGCLPLIQDFLVQVNPRELEQMYLSATHVSNQNKVFQLDGQTMIGLNPENPWSEEISGPFENKVITNGTLIFDDSLKCSGSFEILLTEGVNPYYDLELDSNSIKSFISGFSGKEIIASSIINNAQFRSLVNLKVQSKKPAHQQNGYYFFELPENKKGTSAWHVNYLHSERSTPLEIPFGVNEQYSYEITIPENTRLVNPIELKEMKTPFGELVLSTAQKGNKIVVKRMLMIRQSEISQEFYPDFKSMLDLWNEMNYRKIILAEEKN
ncbi:MAG: DUF3857 domain-containing protein [Bacteroidetes bacterium]|nr:DUF3857 domain-containing protein [Bacteroidota bacterium]